MTSQVTRIAVTPASSFTAYSMLSCIGQGYITGTEQEIELVLHDEESKCELIQGNAMEIVDCVFPLVKNISITCSWQHALAGVDLLIVLPCVSASRHNTYTHLSLWHAHQQMKVVFVGAKNDLRDFLSVNVTLPRGKLLFIDISQSSLRPLSLANRICTDVRPWWFDRKQMDTFHSAHTVDMIEHIPFADDVITPYPSMMLLQSRGSGVSEGQVKGHKVYAFPRL